MCLRPFPTVTGNQIFHCYQSKGKGVTAQSWLHAEFVTVVTKKGDRTVISEANAFLFNNHFGLPGYFFRNYLTGG